MQCGAVAHYAEHPAERIARCPRSGPAIFRRCNANSQTPPLDKFVRKYDGQVYCSTALIRRKGRVVAFAMDEARHIWYAVLDLGGENEPSKGGQPSSVLDVSGWPDRPSELPFPREIAEVAFGIAHPLVIPVHKKNPRSN